MRTARGPSQKLYRFVIHPADPSLQDEEVQVLLKRATKNALGAARAAGGSISAETRLEGGFGGIGELSATLSVVIPVAKIVMKTAALGAVGSASGAAGKLFFETYLAPRLRKLNLLPSKLQATHESRRKKKTHPNKRH